MKTNRLLFISNAAHFLAVFFTPSIGVLFVARYFSLLFQFKKFPSLFIVENMKTNGSRCGSDKCVLSSIYNILRLEPMCV